MVPGVLPREKALGYADQAYNWVENFGLGYKRDDVSTRTLDKLHFFAKGGLTNRYGVAHEQFIWDIKQVTSRPPSLTFPQTRARFDREV